MKINVSFNEREVQMLARVLDIATKAGGLAVAKDVVMLADKIEAAANDAEADRAFKEADDEADSAGA